MHLCWGSGAGLWSFKSLGQPVHTTVIGLFKYSPRFHSVPPHFHLSIASLEEPEHIFILRCGHFSCHSALVKHHADWSYFRIHFCTNPVFNWVCVSSFLFTIDNILAYNTRLIQTSDLDVGQLKWLILRCCWIDSSDKWNDRLAREWSKWMRTNGQKLLATHKFSKQKCNGFTWFSQSILWKRWFAIIIIHVEKQIDAVARTVLSPN